jgi:hypothetical protein
MMDWILPGAIVLGWASAGGIGWLWWRGGLSARTAAAWIAALTALPVPAVILVVLPDPWLAFWLVVVAVLALAFYGIVWQLILEGEEAERSRRNRLPKG